MIEHAFSSAVRTHNTLVDLIGVGSLRMLTSVLCIACLIFVSIPIAAIGQQQPVEDSMQAPLNAEPNGSTGFQVRQVFVPESDLSILGENFVPTDREKLVELINGALPSEDDSRSFSSPYLSEAVYVARLVGQDLVSNGSRWTIDLQNPASNGSVWTIPETTIAWRPLRLAKKPETQPEDFSNAIRFRSSGMAELPLTKAVQAWIGWSARGEWNDNRSQIRFSLTLPSAVQSRLLLDLPPGWSIPSSENIATKLKDISGSIPSDWPVEFARAYTSGNWWIVYLPVSGTSTFTIGKDATRIALPFSGTINSQRIEYDLNARGLEVSSTTQVDYSFDGSNAANALGEMYDAVLSVDAGLGITDVLINSTSRTWKAGETANTIVVSIEKPLQNAFQKSSQVTVKAIAAWVPENNSGKLPTIRWDSRYVLDGSTSIRLADNWTATSVRTSVPSAIAAESGSKSGSRELRELNFSWQGNPPNAFLKATHASTQQPVDSVTRLINTNDGFTATTRILLPARFVNSGSFTIETDSSWTLESVQPIDASKATASFRNRVDQRAQSPGGFVYDITASTVSEAQSLSLEIICKKTKSNDSARPADKPLGNDAILYLEACRPITFKDFSQSDFYIIEATGRYTIDGNAGLIASRIPEADLPAAYQLMLPRLGGFWLIKPDAGRVPKLAFCRQAAPFTAELDTRIRPTSNDQEIQTTYTVRCTPIAGTVTSVLVSLSNSSATGLQWNYRSIGPSNVGNWAPIESIPIDTQGSNDKSKKLDPKKSSSVDGSQRFRLVLPNPSSSSFELESVCRSPLDAPVELPLIPEANQLRARLDIESNLSIAELPKASFDGRLQPQGLWFDDSGLRYQRVLYAQSPDLRISIVRKHQSPDAWISKLITEQKISTDGRRDAYVSVSLHHKETSYFEFKIANGWKIRNASLEDEHLLQVVPTKSEQHPWMVLLPKVRQTTGSTSRPSVIKLVLDGTPIPLEDGSRIDWPNLQPTCEVLGRESIITMPDAFSFSLLDAKQKQLVESSDTQSAYWDWKQANLDGRFKSRRWLINSPFAFLNYSGGYTTTPVIDTNDMHLQYTSKVNAWQSIFIIATFIGTFLLSRYSPAACLMMMSLLFIGIVIVPEPMVDWLQLITSSAIVGFLFVLLHRLVNDNKENVATHALTAKASLANGNSKSIQTTKGTALLIFMLTVSACQTTTFAQESEVDSQQSTAQQKPFYSVIFPVDGSGQLSGDIAYVGEEFLKWLNRRNSTPATSNYVLSAKHEVLIDSSLEGTFTNPNCIVTSLYNWNIEDPDELIRIVLPGDKSTIVSVSMDGVDQTVPIDVSSNESFIELRPSVRARMDIKIKFRCPLDIDLRNVSSIRFPVIPIANSTVDIFGLDTADLQSNAVGQVTNPGVGRYTIALGKRNEIIVRWRQGQPRLTTTTVRANVDLEWSISSNHSVAKCVVTCPGPSTEQNYFDVECERQWEPIGFDWGDGKVIDVLAGSTNLKKRFRVQWKDVSDASRRQLRLFLHRSHDAKSPMISLPAIELSDTIVDARSVAISQSSDSRWDINRNGGWLPFAPKSPFLWTSTDKETIQAFRTQDLSATLSIQPTSKTSQPSVDVKSSLEFGSDSVSGVTEFQFEVMGRAMSDFVLLTSAATRVQSIQSDGNEIPFAESILDDGTSQVQVFANTSRYESKRFKVRYKQIYSRGNQWRRLPSVAVRNASTTSLHVSASRLLDLPIEFQGTEGFNLSSTLMPMATQPKIEDEVSSQKQPPSLTPSVASALPFQLFKNDQSSETLGENNFSVDGIHEHLWDADLLVTESSDDLQQANRKSPLTMQYRIRPSMDDIRGHSVSVLAFEGSAWKYRLIGSVSRGESKIGGLLFDVPTEIVPSLISESTLTQFDSPEPGRRLLLVSPKRNPNSEVTMNSKEPFSFSIEYQLDSDQSTTGLSVPSVRLLNGPLVDQWIAVPKTVNGRKLSWTTSGVRSSKQVPESLKELPSPANEFAWFVPFSQQPDVQLNLLKGTVALSAVSLSVHRIQSQGADAAQLESFFILEPKGVSVSSLKFPSSMRLLSASVNGVSCPFIAKPNESEKTISSAEIQLHSSVLPQFIRVAFAVPIQQPKSDGLSHAINLPYLDEPKASKIFVEVDPIFLDQDNKLRQVEWTSLSHEKLNESMLSLFATCSDTASSTALDSTLPQRDRWWVGWQAFACDLLFPTIDSALTKTVDDWLAVRDKSAVQWRRDPSMIYSSNILDANCSPEAMLSKRNPTFVLNSSDKGELRVELSSRVATESSRLAGSYFFVVSGVLLMMFSIVPGLRKRADQALDVAIQHMRIRPWLLFGVIGILLWIMLFDVSIVSDINFDSAPLNMGWMRVWSGPLLLAFSFILALRQYVFQESNVAARSIAKK
ncbi:MAG: hypothetical protein NTW52_07155 [Planctomycetota bacterium]|nr:hypothetical protein [Planctomycetota bacterium]